MSKCVFSGFLKGSLFVSSSALYSCFRSLNTSLGCTYVVAVHQQNKHALKDTKRIQIADRDDEKWFMMEFRYYDNSWDTFSWLVTNSSEFVESSFWASELPTRDSQFPWLQIAPQKGRLLGGGVYTYIYIHIWDVLHTIHTHIHIFIPHVLGWKSLLLVQLLVTFSWIIHVRCSLACGIWSVGRDPTLDRWGTCVGLCKAKGDAGSGKWYGSKTSGYQKMCWFRLEGILFGSQIGTKSDMERVCYWCKCLGTCSR